MRIVSLLASATEIVCALGAGEMLVGRSHECDNPEWVRRLPACSAPAFDVSVSSGEIDREVRRRLRAGEPLYHVQGELIRELHADLVITQSHCQVCAVTPGDVERSCGHEARQLSLSAISLEQIFEGMLRIAQQLGLDERGSALVRSERQRLDSVRDQAARFSRPTVVMDLPYQQQPLALLPRDVVHELAGKPQFSTDEIQELYAEWLSDSCLAGTEP